MKTNADSYCNAWIRALVSLRFATGIALCITLSLSPSVSKACAGSLEDGQSFIEQGLYELAADSFSKFIADQPKSPEGYRGRIEAFLLMRRYSDAMLDVAQFNAFVVPADAGSIDWILAHYEARIQTNPNDTAALTGGSFAYWWNFDYANALLHLDSLIAIASEDPYAILFRGSSRLLSGVDQDMGIMDFDFALHLDPCNPHSRFIVADGYTYGLPDPERAFFEGLLAYTGGLDTPRINAIFAASFEAWGNTLVSAYFLQRHIEKVTTSIVALAPLNSQKSVDVYFEPGMTVEIPIMIKAGKKVRIETSSPSEEVYDTVAVLLSPNGTPVTGSDDTNEYFAEFQWTAPFSATYRLRVTTFEAVGTGTVRIRRL